MNISNKIIFLNKTNIKFLSTRANESTGIKVGDNPTSKGGESNIIKIDKAKSNSNGSLPPKRKTIDDVLRESIEPKIDAKIDPLNKEQMKEKEDEYGLFLYRKKQFFGFFTTLQQMIIKHFFILYGSSLGFILFISVPKLVFILLKLFAIFLVIRFGFFPIFLGSKLFKRPRSFFWKWLRRFRSWWTDQIARVEFFIEYRYDAVRDITANKVFFGLCVSIFIILMLMTPIYLLGASNFKWWVIAYFLF